MRLLGTMRYCGISACFNWASVASASSVVVTSQTLRESRYYDCGVTATSAFGLGVDQTDVRSVMHVCLPETIDRYYQEVGRGGRDGNASVALLLTTPSDLKTAHGLAEETIISVGRGFERWTAMWLDRR